MMLRTGRFEEALMEARALRALRPGDMQLLLAMGDICVRLGRPSAARQFYAAALRQQPGHPGASERLRRL